MSDHADTPSSDSNVMYLALFIIGGLCVGTGLLNLAWAFGWPDGVLNQDFRAVGFTGIDNISALGPAQYAIPLIVAGVACMIYGNATAWKHTEGY